MKNKLAYLISISCTLSSLGMGLGLSTASAEQSPSLVEHACEGREVWHFDSKIPVTFTKEYMQYINKKQQPVLGFSKALAMRKTSKNTEAQLFGEYWISRALFDSKLVHIAFGGFSSIASRPITAETVGVQIAALGCLVRIQQDHPAFTLPLAAAEKLEDFLSLSETPANREVVWLAAGSYLRTLVSEQKPSENSAQKVLHTLRNSGDHETFAKALWNARLFQHSSTIVELDKFLKSPTVPDSLKRYSDVTHLLMARALYRSGKFEEAVQQLKKIRKSSNELAVALSELSWSYLMGEQYGEAIGTAVNLQAGRLRHTFAPEGPMVMAMALNEICQYPESVSAIQVFRKNYEDSYVWLQNWNSLGKANPNSTQNLYPLAVEYLRKKLGSGSKKIPEKVVSEWVRSSYFISNQQEINLLFSERDASKLLSKSGSHEQFRIANEILELARELKPKVKIAKMKQKPGETLPAEVSKGLLDLRKQVVDLRRLQHAAPLWKIIIGNHTKQVPALESKLVARINSDISSRNQRMLNQLEEIAENIQLIEVEIYNGASQDIIWQNAHPDYKAAAQKMKDEKHRDSKEKTWDWGRAHAGNEEGSEIWEDELGSFKADLYDNCSSKDRYSALKPRASR